MKASHSALVTRLRASLTGPTSARCDGLFIVEMEGVAGMPDAVDALVEGNPFVAGANSSPAR